MSSKPGLRSLLVATGSFIGGVTIGMLLAPKNGREARNWISTRATQAADWVEEQRKTVRKRGENELHNIRQNVHDGLRRNIPDLYEATEHIDLSDHGLNGS